jgi:RNA polymerase sigma-70 factor (ECF subfamily)
VLWEQFDQYEEGTSFGAWAVSIAKYQVFNFIRKKKKNGLCPGSTIIQNIVEIAEQESASIDMRLEVLQVCLNKLDRIGRSLLSLRYQHNISVKEIAQRRGVSSGVIYRKLSKVFDALRKCVRLSIAQQS